MAAVTSKVTISGIAALGLWFGACVMDRTAAAETAGKAVVQNPKVAQGLTDAKKLAARKQWDGALAALARARAVPDRSAYADLKIDEYQGYIFVQQGKPGAAAAIYERLALSPAAGATEKARFLDTAARLDMQAQQYGKSAELAARALRDRPEDRGLLELAGQAQYQAQDFKRAAVTLQHLITLTEKAGGKPKETWLQMLLSSSDHVGDKGAVNDSWEALLRYYPTRDYWKAVLSRRDSQFRSEALELGYQRLRFDLGLLEDPAAFEDLALGAIDAGVPGEAVRVLQSGLDAKVLAGRDAARYQRMLDYAKRAADENRSALTDLAGAAAKAATGQPSIAVGQSYLGYGDYAAAIAALRKGFDKGSLQDPDRSRIDLGIAYLKNAKLDEARRTFDSVGADSSWRDLAQLWKLRAMS